jgi:Zinc-finger domain of monoamine-oxidase A repressor R1/JmjC domain, hydroxylase
MVEASDGSMENGEPTRPGSSIWFMTETKDRHAVAEYWTSVLGHDIDLENHFAQINAWRGAPFKTWVVEQKPGDLILVPPLAAHQVWNRGTRTVKVAWNRITVETLKIAMGEALPKARIVCRDEQYKNKAIVFYALDDYANLLKGLPTINHPAAGALWKDFEHLFSIYTDILLSESLSPGTKDIEYVPFDSNVTCSYCRCNIFNRFLTCPNCVSDESDTYDICMDCYVLGRSCQCISKLRWVEQFKWQDLRSRHDQWRRQIISLNKGDKEYKERKEQFPVLHIARLKLNRKPIAEICQGQLKVRPWVDIKNPTPPSSKTKSITPSDTDNDEPRPRKRRKSTRDKKEDKNTGFCHMCRNTQPNWKLAACSGCDLKYCYASLFAAFDVKPEEAMGQPHWLCPRCRKTCSCTPCQRDHTMKPHEPKRVSLGLDTIKVADPRSVESLVNMRVSNEKWLPNLGEKIAERLRQRREEQERRCQEVRRENEIVTSSMVLTAQGESDVLDCIDPSLELDSSLMGPPLEAVCT